MQVTAAAKQPKPALTVTKSQLAELGACEDSLKYVCRVATPWLLASKKTFRSERHLIRFFKKHLLIHHLRWVIIYMLSPAERDRVVTMENEWYEGRRNAQPMPDLARVVAEALWRTHCG